MQTTVEQQQKPERNKQQHDFTIEEGRKTLKGIPQTLPKATISAVPGHFS